MGKSVLKIHRAEVQEIKKWISSNEAYTVGMRLFLVYLVAKGHSSRKLSELHQISFKQITNWVHRFEKEGIEGLKDRAGRGRKSAMNIIQMESIKNLVLTENPKDHGYDSIKWTGPILVHWIQREFGLQYQKAQIYVLLNKVGIIFQKKKGFILNV